jgi:hypothetical protein
LLVPIDTDANTNINKYQEEGGGSSGIDRDGKMKRRPVATGWV